jgi:DNA replication protein DnaC
MHKTTATLPLLLKELYLSTFQQLWEPLSEQAQEQTWSYGQYLSTLCENEVDVRYQNKLKRNLKQAQLPMGKTLSTFDFSHTPNLNKAKIKDLAENTHWVKNKENVLLFGNSGTGKTHLASAIAYGLIEKGLKAFFTSTTTLVQKLQAARQKLILPQTLAKLDFYQVLVLDASGGKGISLR